jgi:hypothetical protein
MRRDSCYWWLLARVAGAVRASIAGGKSEASAASGIWCAYPGCLSPYNADACICSGQRNAAGAEDW